MRAYVENYAGANKSRLCPAAGEYDGVGRRKSQGAPSGSEVFLECGTMDQAWIWPTNGWGTAQAKGYHGGFAFNSWLYAGGWPADWADEKLAYKRESDIEQPSLTPIMGDSFWVDAWPKADQRPSINGYYGWNDGGVGRYLVARHSAGVADQSKMTRPAGSFLKGGGNFVFSDGHGELVKFPRLWQLRWHKDWKEPTRPPM
jgi:hypothetical protein